LPILLDDAEIAARISEPKVLPADYRSRIQARPKSGHKERELDIVGASGNEFRLILRQSSFNPLDFSIILAYRPPKSTQLFRLRRYNGKSHQHTNVLEKQTFYDFHIHTATFRYQRESGLREDAYADPTNQYSDFQTASDRMISQCGFVLPDDGQAALF
jgi:hypothetical protein